MSNITYSCIMDFKHLCPRRGSSNPVNVFAVVCSYTAPQLCEGAYKHITTFYIVDPTVALSFPVLFVLHSRSVNSWGMEWSVGDIVRIEQATLRINNYSPQLEGYDDRTRVTIFHRNTNVLTGYPTQQLTVRPMNSNIVQETSTKWFPFLDPAWGITDIGVANFSVTPMREQDVHKLLSLYDWADSQLSAHSLVGHYCDNLHNQSVTLHDVQLYLHRAANSQRYDMLLPAETRSSESTRMQNSNNGKCDLVCLVMKVLPASASVDGLARIFVWDGTTNGTYTPAPEFSQDIHVAVNAPAVYDTVEGPPHHQSDFAPLGELYSKLNALTMEGERECKCIGSAMKIRAADLAANQLLAQCKVGMWISIRNMYAITKPETDGPDITVVTVVKADSHVCPLNPKYRDVRRLVKYYLGRVALLRAACNHPVPSSPPASPSAAATSSVVLKGSPNIF